MNKDQQQKLEADLWSAADKLCANSDLKSSEYATPMLGLVFLKFVDNNYLLIKAAIRRTLIEQNLIYGMLKLPLNMFYTATLPATLWFFGMERLPRLISGKLPVDQLDIQFPPSMMQDAHEI